MSPGGYITTECRCGYVSAAEQQHLLRGANMVLGREKETTCLTRKHNRIVRTPGK